MEHIAKSEDTVSQKQFKAAYDFVNDFKLIVKLLFRGKF